jgi:hypothetical protein
VGEIMDYKKLQLAMFAVHEAYSEILRKLVFTVKQYDCFLNWLTALTALSYILKKNPETVYDVHGKVN